MIPVLSGVVLEPEELPPGEPPVWRPTGARGPIFVLAEIEVYRPGTVPIAEEYGVLAAPVLALAREAQQLEFTEKIQTSDWGYRTRQSDPLGVQVYPPTLDDGISIDTMVPLAPGSVAAGASWGSLRLVNMDQRYSGLYLGGANPDARPVRVWIGRKSKATGRGVWVDPAWSTVRPFWAGVAENWRVGDGYLEIPLRDASYWLEQPITGNTYLGTGGLEGGEDLKGKRKPRARGGTVSAPIRNVTPVLVDAPNLIYQTSDGRGTIPQIYEGGAPVFTLQGTTSDITTGTTSPGQYRTSSTATGTYFQLGSAPVRPITCDVTGQFPVAGTQTLIGNLARYLLTEDCAVPAEFVDAASFLGLSTAFPVDGGIWIGSEDVDGASVVGQVLASVGAVLLSGRNGALRAVALRWPPAIAAVYTETDIISVSPVPLPVGLDPPPYRMRVGYARNYTVQTSDLPSTLTAAQRSFLTEEWRFGAWASNDVLLRYRKPSDPPVIPTALLSETDADDTAEALGAIWGTSRRMFDVELPVENVLRHQEGDGVILDYPLDDLLTNATALIVGSRVRLTTATAILRVVV